MLGLAWLGLEMRMTIGLTTFGSLANVNCLVASRFGVKTTPILGLATSGFDGMEMLRCWQKKEKRWITTEDCTMVFKPLVCCKI